MERNHEVKEFAQAFSYQLLLVAAGNKTLNQNPIKSSSITAFSLVPAT